MSIVNHFKTGILLFVLTLVMLGIGQLIGGRTGLVIAIIFALVFNVGSYWYSHKIVLKIYKAKKADPTQYKELHQMVEEVAMLSGIQKPEVYIIPSEAANAFATGRSPKNAVVACTTGIMSLLTKDELRGVIAHEISHIKNKDMLVTTIAATIAGVISYVATMAQWAAIFGGFGRDNDNGPNIINLLVLAIVSPLIAGILQMAISRSREYLADTSGAKLLHTGEPLASALLKLENGKHHSSMKLGSSATSSLFIVNPFKGSISGLFSTHPSTEQRVKRLRSSNY